MRPPRWEINRTKDTRGKGKIVTQLEDMQNQVKAASPYPIEDVLQRHEAGETIAEIAKSLGVPKRALYKALLKLVPEEWKAQQAAKSLADLDDGIADLDVAKDNIAISRAREKIRAASWNLERTWRSIYGDRLSVEHSGEVPRLIIHTIEPAPNTQSLDGQ